MKLKLIIVEPEYPINVGYIARISKNFGVKKLYFVNPKIKITGDRAIMFAKHARDLLKAAKTYKTFDQSISDCDVVVGTTGIWRKAKANFKRIYLLDETIKKLKALGKEKTVVGLVIGREGTGLVNSELEKCDIISYIGSNPNYPVLNISHALAIFLYSFTKNEFASEYREISDRAIDKKELDYLFRSFDKLISKKKIRNKKAVTSVFKRLVYLSQPNKQEIHALITALK